MGILKTGLIAIIMTGGLLARAAEPASAPASAPVPDSFFLHDGDRVVFLGDDLFDQGSCPTLVESYVLTRYPDWHITFRNVGWSGDTAWLVRRSKSLDQALQRDVLALKPTVVLIEYGMNDARDDKNYDRYISSLTQIIDQTRSAGAMPIVLSPPAEERYEFGQPAGSAYNIRLRRFAEGARLLALREKIPYVDILNPEIALIDAGRKAGLLSLQQSPDRLTLDSLRPNAAGSVFLAATLLKGLGAACPVQSSDVNGVTGSVNSALGCSVTQNKMDDKLLHFVRLDATLPWPWKSPTDSLLRNLLALDEAQAVNDLNPTLLRLGQAGDGNYQLFIDNQHAGGFKPAQLAQGLHLNFLGGAVADQQQKLLNAIQDKNDSFRACWRQVIALAVPAWLAPPDLEARRAAEAARMDQVIALQEDTINGLRTPLPRQYAFEFYGTMAPPVAPPDAK